MTAIELPAGMVSIGRIPAWLLARGLPMGGLWLLNTVGSSSGITRTIPVALVRLTGVEFIVSPFGEVAWVKNYRANGVAFFSRGRASHRVTFAEIHDERKPAVLRAYRRAYRPVPFVRAAFVATSSSPVHEFAAEAQRHPVFLVTRVGAGS